METLSQIVLVVGRINSNGQIDMLGTGCLISNNGKLVTSRHVVSNTDNNLVVILPKIEHINEYQDTSDNSCEYVQARIIELDPIRDIAILQTNIINTKRIPMIGSWKIPKIEGFDITYVGDEVYLIGYPHCVEGRKVLTYQKALIGAKVLLDSQGIKSKYAVINTQTRPGQSGSIILSKSKNEIVGILVGAFISGEEISLGGINPRELHQTTHCISAEYIKDMI
ncbi:MAG: trypsin-like peptidase domain-containing protein [Clostridioides difficile]|nr:trypsin-like peptidase domain-containing protein [Clostridioides difficile]